jgi:RES domain-containing protein
MKLVALACNAFRVHDPKWSFAPVSGAGAARFGGRANRPGVDALYLSLELETALSGTNLVLYNDMLGATDLVRPYDPDRGLSRNHASWN